MSQYIKKTDALRIVDLHYGPCNGYNEIKRLPAEDIIPVVHGKWIRTVQENGCAEWTEFRCSVCGAVFDGNDYLFSEWRGCPVCLSRMDGE